MKITPCLWFDNEAEEVAKFYISVFPNSRIKHIEKYPVETPSNKPIGSVMTVIFELDGNEFMGLNGGDYFKITEAISFIINCKNQEEINYYYDKLSAVPEAEICGWLKDKYGVSWQLISEEYDEMMNYLDEEKKKKVMEALLKMKRIDMDELKRVSEEK
jgi:predicted 3-demethylubiquinone-9 3-methyltransferase (glyoxalase superfamily)